VKGEFKAANVIVFSCWKEEFSLYLSARTGPWQSHWVLSHSQPSTPCSCNHIKSL